MSQVRITDVSPRDGLQNESAVIPAARKAELVRALCASGVDEVEVTSFVSPRWVPQMGDGAEVLSLLRATPLAGRAVLSALVPNEKGLDAALAQMAGGGAAGSREARLGKISVFAAASETFSRKNTNGSIDEVLERFVPVVRRVRALPERLLIRGYVSCAIACPFEGPMDPQRVAAVGARLLDMGVDEVDLGDTIGAGTPETVRALLDACARELGGRGLLTLHLHDTFGRAAACVRAALDAGVTSFDGAAGGLGGCPYASTPGRRAPGNLDTGVLVRTVHAAGFATGVDLDALERAGALARAMIA